MRVFTILPLRHWRDAAPAALAAATHRTRRIDRNVSELASEAVVSGMQLSTCQNRRTDAFRNRNQDRVAYARQPTRPGFG